ncbi:helix-turn-helix transcriptional regulator [Dietzia natronolimnaea]|nr:LuxR family transcriptional regulator [Dietzia natronolimnaea]
MTNTTIEAMAQSFADATDQHPVRRVDGALQLSQYVLKVDAIALTILPASDGRPHLVSNIGYEPGVVGVYEKEWFGATRRRISRHVSDPSGIYPWERSEFIDTEYVNETLKPAGYRNGITRPLTAKNGSIFGFIHTNIAKPSFDSRTQEMFRETVDRLAHTAWAVHVRMTSGLTEREREILALIRDGLSNPEIAERLYISRRTVATHVDHLMRKTGTRSRAHTAAWAVRYGF